MSETAFTGASVFDGRMLHEGKALLLRDGVVAGIVDQPPRGAEIVALTGGILAPGCVDLQVNGGAGVMLNDAPTAETLRLMGAAHARLGATSILPTLITDRPNTTMAAIDAVEAAQSTNPSILGLHLEGPHLATARKGAHDAALIREMTQDDLALYCHAAKRLKCLKITLAPEVVTPAQIAALVDAGILVSLGHSDADAAQTQQAIDAGARCATHLFNAMRPIESRAPGIIGAILDSGQIHAGLIADAIHVDPVILRMAVNAKRGADQLFLVSDAMATAGSAATEFQLNNRQVLRRDGRLTLADGTLAGADLTLPEAVKTMVERVGISLAQALAMATSIPAALIGSDAGVLRKGGAANFIHLDQALKLRNVWRDGVSVPAGS